MIRLFLSFSFFICLSVSQAFQVPALTDSVVDEAGLMNSSIQARLANALKVIHSQGGPQVAVLTVNTLDELTIEEAAYKVVKEWKLGTAEKDNGVLLMISKNERRLRIEVGQGVEGDLTDAYSRRIIDNTIVPLFRHGQTSDGILLGVSEILLRMNPPYDLGEYLEMPRHTTSQPPWSDWGQIIFIVLVVLVLLSLNGGGGRGFRGGFYGGGWGGGFGGGFGGSGGGGWSGGGGGFSGGGASGSW